MTQSANNCTKCGSNMRRGFIVERSESSFFPAQWIEGDPSYRQWGRSLAKNVDIEGRGKFPVRSMRCDQCGFLELYAI